MYIIFFIDGKIKGAFQMQLMNGIQQSSQTAWRPIYENKLWVLVLFLQVHVYVTFRKFILH